ncbi:membrane protein [Bacillus mesophilus]|uniref:YihY/virulence factor BrkB family protein n=1 Tax=Bacillus mesophilus TaxID=1808955 RepID=A0A6M0QAI0_9BACI|nr:YihY/virulence factor BrkB family protein [Bacillus mesophilus]MBM7662629.1 membrane protein [Bacillus mesophilus]NEY73303.1 YihY/virulence factor BrkB family protein [Bacillus mesophilus]
MVSITSIPTFLKDLWGRFHHDEVAGLSAELAYFFLLSLFPFMIFLITLIGYLPIDQETVISFLRQYAPGEAMNLIENNISGIIQNHNSGLLSFGIIATIWSASNGLNAVIRAFNRAYDVKETRSFIVARLMSILLTIAMIIVIVIALLLPVFGKQIGLFIFSAMGLSETFLVIWNAARWIISFFVLFLVFSCLYYFAPNKHLHWKEVFSGAFIATLGWIIVSSAFSYYVGSFGNYSATYGSLGGIIVLMIWFYLTGMIILIGGEINAIINSKREKKLT